MIALSRYLFFLLLSCSLLGAEEAAYDYFPLKKGTFWIYQTHLRYTTGDSSKGTVKIKEKDMTYRVEVTDSFESDPVLVVRLHGFPGDLCWYREGQKIDDHLIVRVGTGHYHLISNHVDEIWKNFQQTPHLTKEYYQLSEYLTPGSLLLETPLEVGKHYGDFSELLRSMYCFVVESAEPFNLNSVKNHPKLSHPTAFDIAMWTNPDCVDFTFVPGLGIVSYEYEHHGTVAEASLNLIEYGSVAQQERQGVRPNAARKYLYQSK